MQPSWISVPWLQFQQLGAPGLPPPQMMSAAPPHYQHLNGFTTLSSAPGLTSGPHGLASGAHGLSSAGGPHGLSSPGAHGLSSATHGMATGGPHTLSSMNTSMSGLNPANVAGGLTVSMANLTPSQPTMTQQAVAMNGLPTTLSNLTTMNGSINVLSGSMNGLSGSINGLHGMHGCLTAVPNGVHHHHHHPHSNHLAGLNLTALGGLGGMAGMGGLMALHPHTGGPPPPHPQALLHLRPRQPAPPPPLAALLAAKKDPDFGLGFKREKRKAEDDLADNQDIKKAKLETKALKAKRPGFSEERYNETSYFIENGLRKVYPYYFTFTTFTKGRWVGEKILDVFAKEFRAHPAEEYERCIKSGTLTVNYERVETDCRLKHNDLLANIVHRHEVPVTAARIPLIYTDADTVVVDKPASIPVHPCGRYRHNTVVFILAKEYNLKNLRTIHRLDRLTSGLLLFGRTPKKAREMEQQIRTRQVTKQYVCRVEGRFPNGVIECNEPIEVVSYKIGVCKVSPGGKDCKTEFQLLSFNGSSSVVLCKPRTGRMHQIRVHLQFLGYPIVNDPLYNHVVFGPNKGKGGVTDKTDDQLIQDLIKIHNAENWLGMDGDVEYSMFKGRAKEDGTDEEGGSLRNTPSPKDKVGSPPTPGNGASPPTPSPPAVQAPDTPNTGVVSCPASPKHLPGTNAEVCRDDYGFKPHMKTVDKNCYECKVRYRDPKPKDLVMFLHALKYSGPGWQFETKMPDWAAPDWVDTEEE